jgi:hypothetical protein
VENGGCERRCVNFPGSFSCLCDVGLKLSADSKSCEPDSCGGPWMYMFLPTIAQGSSQCSGSSGSVLGASVQPNQPLLMACLPVNTTLASVVDSARGS